MPSSESLPRVPGTVIPSRVTPDPKLKGALDFARTCMFGEEGTPRWLGALDREVQDLQRRAHAHGQVAVNRAEAADALSSAHAGRGALVDWRGLLGALEASVDDARSLGDTLRVVLMGRTQAGKSTLLEVLTGGDGSRIGDGRQRNSRDVEERPCIDAPEVLLVDTPGVGAADGDTDFDLAFAQVPRADLVLWVASSEPTHLETAKALRRLAAYGKPILVALNCRAGLEIEIVREDFLADPASVFAGKEDFLPAVHRQLAEGSGRIPNAVLVHAQAAYLARAGGESDAISLWAASGIDDLIAVIRDEAESNGVQRRALRVIDAVRMPTIDLIASLQVYSTQLDRIASDWEGRSDDAGKQMRRTTAKAAELLQAAVLDVTSPRRQWHTTDAANPDGDVQQAWRAEVAVMQSEMASLLDEARHDLQEKLEQVNLYVRDEWANTPAPQLDLRGLTDFGSVAPNLALKIAAGIVVGVVATAIIVGTRGAGTGVAIPAAITVTTVLPALLSSALDFIGTIFKGKDHVRRERRDKTGKQIGPLLDKIDAQARGLVAAFRASFEEGISTYLREDGEVRSQMLMELHGLDDAGRTVAAQIDALDLLAARVLLESNGRPRLADSLRAARRVPGVAVAAEATGSAYAEAVLFPAEASVESVVVWPHGEGPPAEQGLRLMTQLTPGRLRIESLGRAGSTVTLLDDDVTDALRATWEGLISRVTGRPFAIHRNQNNPNEKGNENG